MIAPLRQQAADWFGGRTLREQWLLAVGGAALLIWVTYAFVWQPIETQRQSALRQAMLYERASAAVQAGPVQAPLATSTDMRALNAIVTSAASDFDLIIRRLEPEGTRIRVTLDEAAFQTVILWLEAMQRDSGLRATEVDLSRRPAPGTVNATLLLER